MIFHLVKCLMAWAALCVEEVCGLLYDDGPHLVCNVHSDPTAYWAMDEDEQVALMATRGWPDVVFHTHPGGTRSASTLDHRSALPGVPYAVGTRDWVGLYRDGQMIMEATMGRMTNDVGEAVQGEDEQWYWHVQSPNGQVIEEGGEGYTRKEDASRAMYRARPDLDPSNDAVVPDALSASDAVAAGTAAGVATAGTTPGPDVGPATTGATGGGTAQGYSDGGSGPTPPATSGT